MGVPANRPPAIATANTAYPAAPTAAEACRSSTRYRASQSAAAPSTITEQSVTMPIAMSRRLRRIPSADCRRSSVPAGDRSGMNRRSPTRSSPTQSAAAMPKCTATGVPSFAAPAPAAAPTIPPTLQQAWYRGIQSRPARCSTVLPCTFIATSQAPNTMPQANRRTPSRSSDGASPSRNESAQAGTAVIATAVRLPNRRHSQPVEGIETSEPTPPASSTRPSCAGLACTRSRTAGRRDTQVPSWAPLTAKTSAVPSAASRNRVPASTILSMPPRPLVSWRSAAPSSLLAALVSPDDAAPLPLAPSVPPRPLVSWRSAAGTGRPVLVRGPRADPEGGRPLDLRPRGDLGQEHVVRLAVHEGRHRDVPDDRQRQVSDLCDRLGQPQQVEAADQRAELRRSGSQPGVHRPGRAGPEAPGQRHRRRGELPQEADRAGTGRQGRRSQLRGCGAARRAVGVRPPRGTDEAAGLAHRDGEDVRVHRGPHLRQEELVVVAGLALGRYHAALVAGQRLDHHRADRHDRRAAVRRRQPGALHQPAGRDVRQAQGDPAGRRVLDRRRRPPGRVPGAGVQRYLVLHLQHRPRHPARLRRQGDVPAGRAEGVGLAEENRAAVQRRRRVRAGAVLAPVAAPADQPDRDEQLRRRGVPDGRRRGREVHPGLLRRAAAGASPRPRQPAARLRLTRSYRSASSSSSRALSASLSHTVGAWLIRDTTMRERNPAGGWDANSDTRSRTDSCRSPRSRGSRASRAWSTAARQPSGPRPSRASRMIIIVTTSSATRMSVSVVPAVLPPARAPSSSARYSARCASRWPTSNSRTCPVQARKRSTDNTIRASSSLTAFTRPPPLNGCRRVGRSSSASSPRVDSATRVSGPRRMSPLTKWPSSWPSRATRSCGRSTPSRGRPRQSTRRRRMPHAVAQALKPSSIAITCGGGAPTAAATRSTTPNRVGAWSRVSGSAYGSSRGKRGRSAKAISTSTVPGMIRNVGKWYAIR